MSLFLKTTVLQFVDVFPGINLLTLYVVQLTSEKNEEMISVREAKQLIIDRLLISRVVEIPLSVTLNYVLAESVYSPLDLPPFPQSSMDGYAFSYSDLNNPQGLFIVDQIAAGDSTVNPIHSGQAARIFTGAAVPKGADTIIMQEKTEIRNHRLFILDQSLLPGTHLRPKGSEIKAGDLALSKGSLLGPASIGFLASMGLTKVKVYDKPSIAILITGNELEPPGQTLPYGKVYDSNSFTLKAALQQIGINDITVIPVTDQADLLTSALQSALEKYDIILLTGGVSVGDFDFVIEANQRCGVKQVFHKIKQKPGKPFYFGVREGKYVFGLPGNPASSLTCFYEYIEPAIQKMMGKSSDIKIVRAPIKASYIKPAGLTHFLKVSFDGIQATPLDAQESFRLKSFARANALIVIEENTTSIQAGEEVEVHILPV